MAERFVLASCYESDGLLLPDEGEYQRFSILIQKVAFASRLDRSAAHKRRC